MGQYEFSVDPAVIDEAERRVALEGRSFPTLVVFWESHMLGQEWDTVMVLDYTVPLPPLESGMTFNEVRIAAYTGEVPTKFLYFGTELTSAAPRVAPEMENIVSQPGFYQEYRLTEESCPIPYLELISTTPRVYGNGPQDYYSPPIKVERFDAVLGPELIADNFPKIVANLDVIPGEVLIHPSYGFWQGSRFAGQKKMAITRQGKVVGIRRRAGRSEYKEIVPPEVVRRDPRADVRNAWVAIDLGTTSTVVAISDGERNELIRVGAANEPAKASSDFENPSEIAFANLPRVLKAWSDRVILPLTEWGDLYVGHGARAQRNVVGKERSMRVKATLAELGALPGRLERGEEVYICGRADPDHPMRLQPPAGPVIDEDGISPDDPFDPLELFAYYLGVHINTRQRGLHLRYAIGMPTGWKEPRRKQVLAELRRGLLRSLPAGMVAFDDLESLQVIDAGHNVLSFAAFAFRVFGISPRGEPIPFVSVDAGASETAVLCGSFRDGTPEEVGAGFQRIVEHVEPIILPNVGAELMLHRMAYKVYASSAMSMKNNDIPFTPPPGEEPLAGHEERMVRSFDAQVNVRLLKDAVRPILEKVGPSPVPDSAQLYGSDGRVREVRIMVDRAVLAEWLRGQLSEAAVAIKEAIVRGFEQITRAEAPYLGMRVLLGGRLGMHPLLQERLEAILPQGVRSHKFREPDETNLSAPTVKLATALGILTLRYQPLAPSAVSDDRAGFGWRIGRSKQGKLLTVLDESCGYDAWRELGACTRPEVTVLYVPVHEARDDMSVDEPQVRRITCDVGYDAVGYRIYLRAVGLAHVELSIGPPGGRPDDDAPTWGLELVHGTVVPVMRR